MTIEEVREFAGAVGILLVSRYHAKDELIRTIQMAMGRDACFGIDPCCRKRKCEWSDECPGKNLRTENLS
jgi:hypothetical protein